MYEYATAGSYSIEVFHDALGIAKLIITRPSFAGAVTDSIAVFQHTS